jgi:hypothetical protein
MGSNPELLVIFWDGVCHRTYLSEELPYFKKLQTFVIADHEKRLNEQDYRHRRYLKNISSILSQMRRHTLVTLVLINILFKFFFFIYAASSCNETVTYEF